MAIKSQPRSILERWELSEEELTQLVDETPSLRGVLLGYIAEVKLRKLFSRSEKIGDIVKYDDHDRRKKGDLAIVYRGIEFLVESKSLQSNSVKRLETGEYVATAQCDASDCRDVNLPDNSKLKTTCLVVGGFDLLAVNLFSFENKWNFVFAKNGDLPRSSSSKYTSQQKQFLLSSIVKVTWPPVHPFYTDPFFLLDQIIEERQKATN